MTWQQTYTGRAFTPLAPRLEDICLEDIAHALSNQCRFAGHTREFYSVAEHSVYVSRAVPPEHARLALLHDAAEAYCVDVPRPIKAHLAGYADIEAEVLAAILARFGVPGTRAGWAVVKAADDAVLAAERDQVMGPPPRAWAPLPPPAPVQIACLTPRAARGIFLMRAREIGLGGAI